MQSGWVLLAFRFLTDLGSGDEVAAGSIALFAFEKGAIVDRGSQ